ncbi:MAG TPA: VOC family protein [Baekduia sp.]|uniref:VOC family protein n=1 Tax=Baekduia sp. TaxID=2600305 RepID=UPI002D773401|nr:VOC family protein [Baekduia sp.]HET6507904.1 VOC family protein [Baekduia sp.]
MTPDLGLLRLAHVALISADPAALAAHYVADVGDGPDGVRRLTTDAHHHCLEIHRGAAPGLDHIAFEVRDAAAAGAALDAAGAVAVRTDDAVGYDRAVAFDDPEGNTIKLVSGAHAGDAIAPGDRTFRPSKVGHVGVRAQDPAAQARFFTETIGFRLSDWIGEQVVFLRCNPDHHAPSRNYFMYFDDADGNRIEWVNSIKQIADDGSYVPEVYDPAQPTTWNVWGVMPPPHFLKRIGPGEPAAAGA